ASLNACSASIHDLQAQVSSGRASQPETDSPTGGRSEPSTAAARSPNVGLPAAPLPRWRGKLNRTTGRHPFQTLWIGPRLSALERLSLTSFLHHGHDVHLYTYESVEGVPDGVRSFDAREILSEDRIFRHGRGAGRDVVGSLGAFSDLFRFKLLRERGG